MFYAISYDIVDDRRRLKVMNLLKSYGERIQYSVFEAHLEANEAARLREQLEKIIAAEEDSIRFYPLCAACVERIVLLGTGSISQDPEVIVL
jgi:CRISPR-associated protein Cas2